MTRPKPGIYCTNCGATTRLPVAANCAWCGHEFAKEGSMEARETIEKIAALVRTLPTEEFACRSVSLGICDAAVDLLLSLGGKRELTVFGGAHGPNVIESAEIEIGGIRVRAQKDGRPATAEEAAALDDAKDYVTRAAHLRQ